MKFPFVRAALFIALLGSASFVAPAVDAAPRKAQPAASSRPWLYQNSDVPIDTAWTFGTLSNGLRYAIRRNGVPPGQVSIRLRIDAGSLMERDDERGFAHFMEHLTFRGSKHVPDGESKRIWQRLGVSFGSDSNAQTTPTGTSYALDLPDARSDGLNESMKILAGMMTDPNIVPAAVDAELAVVLAEMREGTSAASKAADATRAFLFAGQPLAVRSPIGTTQSLGAATAARIQAFHDRWYRPENAVIAVSGDIDPAAVEALVRKYFSPWKGKGKAEALPDFGKPSAAAPATAVLVQPGTPTALTLAWLRPWRLKADTIAYNQAKLADMVALQIVNRRLEAAARAGQTAFIAASADLEDVSRSADGTFVSIAPAGDWSKALNDVRAIIEDAKAAPPTEQEIAREYAQIDTLLAVQVENQDTEAGSKQANDIVSAVDIRETTVTPQAALDIYRSARPMMTPAAMLASTRRLFSGDAVRAMLTLPSAQADAAPRLASAMTATVAAAKDARLAADAASFSDLPSFGKPGRVVRKSATGVLDVQSIDFSNGVRLTLFANDAETGKVRINVRFGKGIQALSPTQTGPSWAGPFVLPANGIGKLTQRDIDEITNGRRIGFDFGIDEDAFELSALSRPADYRDQLRLFAAKLAQPGWDAAPVERVKAALLSTYDAGWASPSTVLDRNLEWLLRDRDGRYRMPERADIEGLTPQGFRALWEPLLASGPIEVQIFGDVKADEAIAAVAQSFGALRSRKAGKSPKGGNQLRFPAHNDKPMELTHNGDADQAAAAIAWPTGSGLANAREARQLDTLAQIISDRLFEKMRSTDGAAYSPSATSSYPLAFEKSQGFLLVSSQLKPDRIDYFYGLIASICHDLATTPVSADELSRTIEPNRQLLARASTGNAFWMTMLEGATRDKRYYAATRNIARDMVDVTPADIQRLAARYLIADHSYSVVVLPRADAPKAVTPPATTQPNVPPVSAPAAPTGANPAPAPPTATAAPAPAR